MRNLFLLIAALLMVGCVKKGSPQQVQNVADNYPVEKLFNVDGCTMYRFYDAAQYVYFSNCSGSTQSKVSCGKNCKRTRNVDTTVSEQNEE